MKMNTDESVRINFLDDLGDYFISIESVILQLQTGELEPKDIDSAMRAAHSIKGGAAMMGFASLAEVAHCIEDYLKILRVRQGIEAYYSLLESQLLLALDFLRELSVVCRNSVEIEEEWLSSNIERIFSPLQEVFGDLQQEDEDALLLEEEKVDVSLVLFENGVEDCLTTLSKNKKALDNSSLKQELRSTVEQLAEFGRMSQILPFVQLCESIQSAINDLLDDSKTPLLVQQALDAWERSYALVMLGRSEQILSQFNFRFAASETPNPALFNELDDEQQVLEDFQDLFSVSSISTNFESTLDTQTSVSEHLSADQYQELDNHENRTDILSDSEGLDPEETFSEAQIESQDLEVDTPLLSISIPSSKELGYDVIPSHANLNIECEAEDKDVAYASGSKPVDLVHNTSISELDTGPLLYEIDPESIDEQDLSDINLAISRANEVPNEEFVVSQIKDELLESKSSIFSTGANSGQVSANAGQSVHMVRVPSDQLQLISRNFNTLVHDKNAIQLHLSQLQKYMKLHQKRILELENENTKIKQWYDTAALETIDVQGSAQSSILKITSDHEYESHLTNSFDALEMDQYSKLHLICQEQIESIVKIQEGAADIGLCLHSLSQSFRQLSYTTDDLKETISRVQMKPFSELVSYFPRFIRDLSVKHSKPVDLKILGKETLFDRDVIEALRDPLNHLLRNAFDHGIESPEVRQKLMKNSRGSISIKAEQLGNRAIITISDDGQGINILKIKERLTELGFSQEDCSKLSNSDLLNMIFEPGFSTSDSVTDLSGRGVGMNVVRDSLRQIHGDVEVFTQANKGTTFKITVPLSLSILRVMLVEISNTLFAIQMNYVKEIVPYASDFHHPDADQCTFSWKNYNIPFYNLNSWLKYSRSFSRYDLMDRPKISAKSALIFEHDERYCAILIDKYWGEQEVSVYPVESPVEIPMFLNGTVVLGDGRVVHLFDLTKLDAWVFAEKTNAATSTGASPIPADNGNWSEEALDSLQTILVIDDSIHVRQYLVHMLEKANYQVQQASDGQDAIDQLANGLEVDAIICDIEMPRLDGYGVLSSLSGESNISACPVIMLTSRNNEKHRKLAFKLGASAYFSKPFNENEFLNVLDGLLLQPAVV